MAPRELGDHGGSAAGVHGELPLESLGGDLLEKAAVPVAGLCRKGVGQPAGSVVDEDIHRPKLGLRNVEQASRGLRIGQVSLHRRCQPILRPDVGDDVFGIGGAAPTVCLGRAGVVDISQSKVRHEDAGAALRQHTRGRSADAVVGAGDDGDVAGEVEECHRNGSC